MARTSSRSSNRQRSARQRIQELTEAALKCKVLGHEWEEDPTADWHTPKYDYIRCYRFYFRCRRGCGSVKVGVYTEDGRWVTGYSVPPIANRVQGLGRGAGRAPFWQEYIARQGVTPTGKRRTSDRAKTRKAVG